MNFMLENTMDKQTCDICGEGTARLTVLPMPFLYGTGSGSAELIAHVPAWRCDACGEAYTAEGAEDAQHDAICAHLGRLKPHEIVAMRTRLGLSQHEFAARVGISRASIARWETGAQVQSAFYDRALRKELENLAEPRLLPQFRTDVSDRRAAASAFELRRLVAA